MLTKVKFLPLVPVTGALFALTLFVPLTGLADGIYMNGIGARSMAMGGADVAYASDPLGAMGANPAGLGFLTAPGLDLGFVGAIGQGTFTKAPTSSGSLNSNPNALPEGAFAMPLGPVTLGFSVAPVSAMNADWRYVDPPGGLGGKTTYGNQIQHSEILVLRSAAGLGIAVNSMLSLGASFGVDYNQNTLQALYIFQTQPKLKGAKTLLDLRTDGVGFDGQAGVLFRPLTNLQFGLTYQSETQVESHGDANGDAGAQFGVASLPFHYDANVRNTFPQMVSGGVSWGFHPQWRLALQVDWIGWGGAFTQLPVSLSNGSSSAVNGVAGSSSLQDNVPLNWRDEFVYRGGLEYEVVPNLFLRAGYSYGASPVPDQTLTPLTAAITEQTLTAGIGYHWNRYQVDLAYQYDLPVTRNVGASGLLSGEYSNSSVSVDMHWLSLTIGATF
ncbi:MAG TPA: outer membrane protein transport protein [Candidatus Saccharimonadales bacterium]|nr:outer membrane protein transport protein [Candidatus Saccharimonadales bacterium]